MKKSKHLPAPTAENGSPASASDKGTFSVGICRDCGKKTYAEDRWASNQVDLCAECTIKAGGAPLPEIKRRKPKEVPK